MEENRMRIPFFSFICQAGALLNIFQALMPEISVVKLGIIAAILQQCLVIPLLNDAALFQDHDAVGGFDRR